MKISKLGLLFLAATFIFGALAPRTAQADPEVSFDFFYNSLEPYGEWVDLPDYGLCWHPSSVDEDWAPYMDGYWANTDAGWTWVSYEDWGGITYHYGRWAKISDEGWFWVPDYEWAPAWVSWRTSDDYIGWAPLPPAARWQPNIGFSFWVDSYCDIGPTYYNFCPVRYFGNPALRPVIVDRRQNVTIINHTVNITNITINKSTNIIYNGGPSYAMVARKSIKPIQTLKLRPETSVGAVQGPVMAHQHGNELVVLAPKVQAPGAKFKPAHTARVLPAKPIDTGWAGISDPKVRSQLHSKIKQEAKNVTPEKAPAMPPAPKELQSFEQRIKSQPATATVPPAQPGQGFPGTGKHGKHEGTVPFMTPSPKQQLAQPTNPSAVEPGRPSKSFPQEGGASLTPRDQQKAAATQAAEEQKQRAKEEQLQRKQQASQDQALRAQEAQQRAQEQTLRKEQEKQASKMQQAQREQELQQQRALKSQEQQMRSQEAQQRRAEQMQKAQQEQQIRAQEAQQHRAEQALKAQEQNAGRREREQMQQPRNVPQVQQQVPGNPKGDSKHNKDKDKDSSDR